MNIDISRFKECKILVVGDLMIDRYLWGTVDRISPEAPVQIVLVKDESVTLGGAGNVVNNLICLGAGVWVAGVTGKDDNGKLLSRKLNELGVDSQGIAWEEDRQTTVKTRIIAANQHVVRIDRESRKKINPSTEDYIKNFLKEKIPDVDLVLVSDYGKGLVTKDLMAEIIQKVKKYDKRVIVDPKGLDFSKYSSASLITPNKKEASHVSGIEILDDLTLNSAGLQILEKTDIGSLLITCGKDGMVMFERDKKPYKISAKARQVFDVSGAGDTVIAVLGLAIALGISLKSSAAIANTAAGLVVGKVGTATISQKELAGALRNEDEIT
ncbi:MAG TPA: D-glycero-beta-D-manno-heptose-7-phosphate kinase, partial [Desulfobacteraceae bacterium]|nr:D-glycero-beta-D-manno-heptose-7-phosphate kinase [Desulfobacteraceae bacterium]